MNVNKGEDGKSIFKKIVNKITYENKTIFGIVFILFGILSFFISLYLGVNLGLFIILTFIPAILLCTNETIKNSKILGIICLVIMVIFTYAVCVNFDCWMYEAAYYAGYNIWWVKGSGQGVWHFVPTEWAIPFFVIFIYVVYGYICSLMYFVKTPKCDEVVVNNNEAINIEETNFCKHCGNKLQPDSKFCSNCGKEI